MEDLYIKLKGNDRPELAALLADLDKLNEYQRAAVLDQSKVLLVNAQVGSGKTTVLINKILYLHFVKGIPLESMVVLTFTNKAADEIKLRIKEKNSGIKEEEMRFFGTFHGVCRTLLSSVLPVTELGYTSGFSIYDPNEMLELYERVISENQLDVKYKNKLKRRIQQYKQGKLLYGNMKRDDDLAGFIELVAAEKKRCNAMEFDDIIENAVFLLKNSEYAPEWIIVDEFQDSDDNQLELIGHMKKDKTHIFAVGDPNQVIYTWRGSKRDIFGEFRKAYGGKELTLPINYRSTSTILDAAKAFVGPGQLITGIRDRGKPIVVKKHHNTFNEALYLCDRIRKLTDEGYKYSDIAVLYRKQKQSEVFKDVFEKNGIPYEVSQKKTLMDIPVLYWLVKLLKAAVNPRDRDSAAYAFGNSRYGPGLGKKQLTELMCAIETEASTGIPLADKCIGFKDWCASIEKLDKEALFDYFDLGSCLMPTAVTYWEDRAKAEALLEDICRYVEATEKETYSGIRDYLNNSMLYGSRILNDQSGENGADSVKLMTLHASKGLEFRGVFISAANLGLMPIPAKGPLEEEEEKRLFFVGITRAKDFLEISYHTNPDEFGVYGIPSPFLRMIPPELIESEDFSSRGANLPELRREIKANMDGKKEESERQETSAPAEKARVYHEKYGYGIVTDEDEVNITVDFETYGTKVFLKAFCSLTRL